MVTHYHILIAGFQQRYGMPDNGLSGVKSELLHLYGRGNGLSDIDYQPWYMRSADYARYMVVNGGYRSEEPAKVQIAGYSYGGQTAVDLCWRLQGLGADVDYLALIDPVRRRSRQPWGWLAALNRWAELRVPPNVRVLDWFYQAQDWPRSHNVASDPKKTKLYFQKLHLRHTAMDNAPPVRTTILERASTMHAVTK